MEMAKEIKDYRMLPGDITDPNSFRTRKGKVGGYKEELNHDDMIYINKELNDKLNPFFDYYLNFS